MVSGDSASWRTYFPSVLPLVRRRVIAHFHSSHAIFSNLSTVHYEQVAATSQSINKTLTAILCVTWLIRNICWLVVEKTLFDEREQWAVTVSFELKLLIHELLRKSSCFSRRRDNSTFIDFYSLAVYDKRELNLIIIFPLRLLPPSRGPSCSFRRD